MLKPDDRIWACTGTTVLSFLYDEWALVGKYAHFLLHCDFPPLSKSSIFWSVYAFRFLSLTSRRRLDSDSNDVDEVQKAFHFRTPKWFTIFFFGFGYNGLDSSWLVSLFSIFTLFTIKLKAGTRETGALSSNMHLPLPEKRDDCTVNRAEFCFSGEEKKKKKKRRSQFCWLENVPWYMAHCWLWG